MSVHQTLIAHPSGKVELNGWLGWTRLMLSLLLMPLVSFRMGLMGSYGHLKFENFEFFRFFKIFKYSLLTLWLPHVSNMANQGITR